MSIKKFVAMAIVSVLVFSMFGCSSEKTLDNTVEKVINDGETEVTQLTDEAVEIPNPIVVYDTVADAQDAVAFDFEVPNMVEGYELSSISVINKDLVQLVFTMNNKDISYRVSSIDGDISGIYNDYPEVNSVTVNDIDLVLKGNDGMIEVALWSKNDLSYSIYVEKGLDAQSISSIVK